MKKDEIEQKVREFMSPNDLNREELGWLYYFLGQKMSLVSNYLEPYCGKMPPWFKKLKTMEANPPAWFNFSDHLKFSDTGIVILEPYNRNIEDFESFIAFCRAHKLEFVVSGANNHFPGHCFQVRVAPLKLEQGLYGL